MSKLKLNDYLKTAAAAEFLGISQNTVRAWAEEGEIPVRRNPANGYRLFLVSDLDTFLSKTSKTSKSSGKSKPR